MNTHGTGKYYLLIEVKNTLSLLCQDLRENINLSNYSSTTFTTEGVKPGKSINGRKHKSKSKDGDIQRNTTTMEQA